MRKRDRRGSLYETYIFTKSKNLLPTVKDLLKTSLFHIIFEGVLTYYVLCTFVFSNDWLFRMTSKMPLLFMRSLIVGSMTLIISLSIFTMYSVVYFVKWFMPRVEQCVNEDVGPSIIQAEYSRFCKRGSFIGIILYTICGVASSYCILSSHFTVDNKVNIILFSGFCSMIFGILWNVASFNRICMLDWDKMLNEQVIDSLSKERFRRMTTSILISLIAILVLSIMFAISIYYLLTNETYENTSWIYSVYIALVGFYIRTYYRMQIVPHKRTYLNHEI